MTFTPQRGDYFEVSKLTDEQYKEIVQYYAKQNFCDYVTSTVFSKKNTFLGCTMCSDIVSYHDERIFGNNRRLLTYYDVFPEEETMIDFTKPIETEEGEEAYFLREDSNGGKLVTISKEYGFFTTIFHDTGKSDYTQVRIRNKPELIKPSGWVNVYLEQHKDGFLISVTYEDKDQAEGRVSAARKEYITTISMEELVSGKYKDGFEKPSK